MTEPLTRDDLRIRCTCKNHIEHESAYPLSDAEFDAIDPEGDS